MTKITVELAGLDLLEPMSFALNWVLMVQAWVYFGKLKKWRVSNFSIGWRWFFLFFGFSGLLNGLSHLLFNYTGMPGKGPGWVAAILAVSSMEWAMSHSTDRPMGKTLSRLVLIKLAFFLGLLSINYSFDIVILHCLGMVLFLLVPSINRMRRGQQELNFFFLGALCLISALMFRIMAIDFHIWFNRDDIGHVFFGIASFCFFRGVKVFETKKQPELFVSTEPVRP